jgi:hypothetical protein
MLRIDLHRRRFCVDRNIFGLFSHVTPVGGGMLVFMSQLPEFGITQNISLSVKKYSQ